MSEPSRRDSSPCPSALEDARIIRDYLGGRDAEAAGEALVRKYWKVLIGWIRPRVRNAADAEEIAQESFVRAFRSLAALESPASFLAWILRIAGNLTVDHLRKRQTPVSIEALGEDTMASPAAASEEDELEKDELLTEVLEAVARLPEKYRMAITLRYQLDLPAKEIAALLREPEGTIRNRIFRALAKVRRMLGAERASRPSGLSHILDDNDR